MSKRTAPSGYDEADMKQKRSAALKGRAAANKKSSSLIGQQSAPRALIGQSTKAISPTLMSDVTLSSPVVMPVYQSSTYIVKDVEQYAKTFAQGGYVYQRMGNPNGVDVERRINSLEGGDGTLAFSSGMSCVSTVLFALLSKGDHVLYQNPIFSAVHSLIVKVLPRFGIQCTPVDVSDGLDKIEQLIQNNTKLLIGESPSNPHNDVLDLRALSALASRHAGLFTLVDATFASPCLAQPILYGIDLVWHSGSKYIGGHSDCMAGVLTCKNKEIYAQIKCVRSIIGTNLAPSEAALMARGLKTLVPRMRTHCDNAMAVAEFLQEHHMVARVYYPGLESHPGHQTAKDQMTGFGGMVAFEIRGGLQAAKAMVESCRLLSLSISLGGVESLIQHPASMTHGPMIMNDTERRQARITDGLIRISVGIEDIADIIADLNAALTAAERHYTNGYN